MTGTELCSVTQVCVEGTQDLPKALRQASDRPTAPKPHPASEWSTRAGGGSVGQRLPSIQKKAFHQQTRPIPDDATFLGTTDRPASLLKRVSWQCLPWPLAPGQAAWPTFLGFLKAIVLCQPLSVGHVDVILKLRVLLAQSEGLEGGANAVLMKQSQQPPGNVALG